MPSNILNIPLINPFKFVVEELTYEDRYNTTPFDDAFISNQVLETWQEKTKYIQKVQNNDGIYFQFNANYGPLSVELVNCKNEIVANGVTSLVNSTYFKVPFFGYECTINISNPLVITEGVYFIKIKAGSPSINVVSEAIYIKEKHTDTMLFEYTNSSNYFDVIFQNKEQFRLRCEMALLQFKPGSNDVVYEDEPANLLTLSAYPYRVWTLKIGKAIGIPDWMADKINRSLCLDTIKLDGKYYTKNDGAKLEPNGIDEVVTKGWAVELRESKARTTVPIVNDNPLNESIVIMYPADVQLFGGLGTTNILVTN